MELCSRCHKHIAIVYISTNMDTEKPEGICLKCAKELGMKQVDYMISKIGIPEEELDRMMNLETELIELPETENGDDDKNDGKAPMIDIKKFLGQIQSEQPNRRRE